MEVATTYNAAERLEQVLAEIASAAKLGRRLTADIDLIAVSKTRSAAEIAPLLEAGHHVFGENRVKEAANKWPEMKAVYHSVELHLVGQLQSNKAGEAVALFDAIHSVDRLSLISALGKAMRDQSKQVPCFIQVNIGAEQQKGGCAVEALPEMITAAQGAGVARVERHQRAVPSSGGWAADRDVKVGRPRVHGGLQKRCQERIDLRHDRFPSALARWA